jgi:NADH dehydrogenase
VIIGGGFAGVAAVRALKKCEAEITLIDRRNHHIFQPLLYQVATSVLSPAEVAAPIRQLAAQERNLSVMMAEVIKIDPKAKTIDAQTPEGVRTMPFDYLVMAAGVHSSYFGHDEFAPYAPSLKTISNAEAIRGKILNAYERAEWTDDPEERARLMRFVLVGAGPTGVELAASIAQMATVTLRSNFRRIDPAKTSIILVEAGPRTLPTFAESLSTAAAKRLEKLGVQIMVGAKVERVDEQGVIVGGKRIASGTVLWTAGVTASPLVKMLGVATDRAGRASVTPYLNLPDDPDIFVVGDAASVMQNGKPVPGVAQAAIQQGRYVGTLIAASLIGGEAPRPFSYFDRGNMAVVGKNFAVLERGSIRLSGALIWLLWAMIHVMFLPQLQNRLRVQTQWLWSYFTGQRSSRLIPETPNSAAGETAKTEELGSTPAISIQPQPLARTA